MKTKPPGKTKYKDLLRESLGRVHAWFNRNLWNKIVALGLTLLLLMSLVMYGIGQWYVSTRSGEYTRFGVSFIPAYAEYLGVDPQETFAAIVDDLGIKRMRLVSYWNRIERTPGVYDFSELDWQFQQAKLRNVDITLAIGLRQPRWPECHAPDWAASLSENEKNSRLQEFIAAVVHRYKYSPTLVSYQLENEFHLDSFGECGDHDRERLVNEFKLVREIDPDTPIVLSRSNNLVPSWPVGEPRADIIGAAVYKRNWEETYTKRYFEYPVPSWYYSSLAGAAKLTTGRDSFIHELQAEPWLPPQYDMRTAPTEEMYKSFNPEMVDSRIDFALKTGLKPIDLWGAEWWYYMKEVRDEPAVWQAIQDKLDEVSRH